MKKKIYFWLSSLVCVVLVYLLACYAALPTEICVLSGDEHTVNQGVVSVLSVTNDPVPDNIEKSASTEVDDASLKLTLKAFGIPVKNVLLDILPDIEVMPWGVTVGVRIDTDGILVLGTGIVTDDNGMPHNPSEGVLKSGDLVMTANGMSLGSKEDLIEAVEKSDGKIKLKIKRDGKIIDGEIDPVVSTETNLKKIGAWVRDSTQGIGTITYYNPESNKFAALGHGIMDIDTKQLMTIKSGIILPSDITSVKKGKKGSPGELVGVVNEKKILGRVTTNTTCGIYGTIEAEGGNVNEAGETLKIALQDKVHEGPALIRSNIANNEVKEYDVYIESVNRYNSDSSRGMVIRITDPELLEATGGIVQGMSGSPIIQNNMLIGAVTHVFVQDPTKGYGIFIENMLKLEKLA